MSSWLGGCVWSARCSSRDERGTPAQSIGTWGESHGPICMGTRHCSETGIRTIKCAVLLVEGFVVAEAGPEADILR